MTLRRLLLAAGVLAGLASTAWWTQQAGWTTAQAVEEAGTPAGLKMTAAADRLVGMLDDGQKAKGLFAFDDAERTNWHFVPLQKDKKPLRKGLRLDEMTDAEKDAARDLLKTGASDDGYNKAVTIMSLENILRELEKNGANVRNPEWYFVSIFGKPAKTGKWGWRVEGHHLSLNFTLEDGKVIGSTPAFFGANPALVMERRQEGAAHAAGGRGLRPGTVRRARRRPEEGRVPAEAVPGDRGGQGEAERRRSRRSARLEDEREGAQHAGQAGAGLRRPDAGRGGVGPDGARPRSRRR